MRSRDPFGDKTFLHWVQRWWELRDWVTRDAHDGPLAHHQSLFCGAMYRAFHGDTRSVAEWMGGKQFPTSRMRRDFHRARERYYEQGINEFHPFKPCEVE